MGDDTGVDDSTDDEDRYWIVRVDIYMPNEDYAVNPVVPVPGVLHDGEWDAAVNTDETPSIRWEHISPVTSEAYGDIREGESLDFTFTAATNG